MTLSPIQAQITLLGLIISFLLNLFSLSFLPLLVFRLRRKLSVHFLINLISTILAVIISLTYSLQLLAGWNGQGKN